MYPDDLILLIWGIEHKERSATCSGSCRMSVVQYFFAFDLSLCFICSLTESLSHTLLPVKSVNILIWALYFLWLVTINFLLIVLKVLAWIWVSCDSYRSLLVLFKLIIKIALQSFFVCSIVTFTKIQFENYPIVRLSPFVIKFNKFFVIKKYPGLNSILKNFLLVFDLTHPYLLLFQKQRLRIKLNLVCHLQFFWIWVIL